MDSFWSASSGRLRVIVFIALQLQLRDPLWTGVGAVLEDAADGGFRDAVDGGDLLERVAELVAVVADLLGVNGERRPPDLAAIELGAAHAALDSFHDQAALELGDSADDDQQSPAHGSSGIDVLAQRDELDVDALELVEQLEEVASAARQSVAGPYQDQVDAAAAGVVHHA